MTPEIRIGLIGDYHASVVAHQAIPVALQLAARDLALTVVPEWVPTEEIQDVARVAGFDGLWCVPANPYRNVEGALRAVRFAREQRRPFLGTCGGFQHAVIEYARNVLGWADADHAETAPDAVRPVIAPLSCALVEVGDKVRFRPGSRIFAAYDGGEATEGYRCSYGINPQFQERLMSGELRISAQVERARITTADTWVPHALDAATLEKLVGRLRQIPNLRRAYLVRKAVRWLPEHPLYVVGFGVTPWYRWRDGVSGEAVIQELKTSVEWPGETFILNIEIQSHRFRSKFQRVEGARIL